MNVKHKNIREMYQGIRVHKKGFQARENILRYENGDVVADPKNILNSWTKYFSQLLNVYEGQDLENGEVQYQKINLAVLNILTIAHITLRMIRGSEPRYKTTSTESVKFLCVVESSSETNLKSFEEK